MALAEDDENSRCLSCNTLTFYASRKSGQPCKLRKSLLQRSVHLSTAIRRITKDYIPLGYVVFSHNGNCSQFQKSFMLN
jgi:hypothetical protein